MGGVLLVEDDDHVEKLLGCQMQSNMKWGHQYSGLILKLKKRIAGLEKLKYIAPSSVLKVIAEGVLLVVLRRVI